MKRTIILFAIVFAFGAVSCEKDPSGADDMGGGGAQSSGYAPDVYWSEDYSGRLGIQVSTGDTPMMMLADLPLYITGVNCYDLFNQSVNSSMNTSVMEATVAELLEQEVPVVRFNCNIYHASELKYYFEQKDRFFANLKKLAELCDEAHILLVPSVFWQIATLPGYYEEELKAWGDKESRTYAFMLAYTAEVVNLLKDHKCIAAWEFGNEFNLAADIAIAGYPDIPASAIGVAMKGFADVVKSIDTHGRLISSGHSVMRNAQWHLANERNWTIDSFAQYVEMTGIMTPDPIRGMSEHIYEEQRSFSDRGTLDRKGQIAASMECAKTLGKVFYVGEFTGTADAAADVVKGHYDTYFDLGVQMSLIWNYAYYGNVEHSFKAATREGNIAFSYMRDLNRRFFEATSNK